MSGNNAFSSKLKSPQSILFQKLFWRAGGEVYLKDEPLALEFLKNSLRFTPKTFSEQNLPIAVTKIKDNSAFKDAITNKMNNLSETESFNDEKTSVEFTSKTDMDLFLALGKADIFMSGVKRENGKWKLNIRVEDTYNFDEIRANYSGKMRDKIATAANNAAFFSQNTYAINPFKSVFSFEIEYPFE